MATGIYVSNQYSLFLYQYQEPEKWCAWGVMNVKHLKTRVLIDGESKSSVSAYTLYRHLQYYCSHPSLCMTHALVQGV